MYEVHKNSLNRLKIGIFLMLTVRILCTGGDRKYIYLLSLVLALSIKLSVCKNNKIDKVVILLLLPIVFYIINTLTISLINSEYSFYFNFFKQIIFMATPILSAYAITELTYKRKIDISKIMFWALVIVFFLKNIGRLNNIFDIDSDLLEGTEAFIFGIFLIYFTYKKNKILILISFVCMYLGHKRIALFSSILIVSIVILERLFKNKLNITKLILIFTLLVGMSYAYIYLVNIGEIQGVFSYLNMHMMGRDYIYSIINNYYEFKLDFYGRGMGYIEYILGGLNINGFNNLHSDILKLYIELGTIGYYIYMIIHIYVYICIYKINNEVGNLYILFTIFTLMNMFTDNIIIYVYYLVPLYSIIFIELKNKKELTYLL